MYSFTKLDKRFNKKRNLALYKDRMSGKYTVTELIIKYQISKERIRQIIARVENYKFKKLL